MTVYESTGQAELADVAIDHAAIELKLKRHGFWRRNVWRFVFVLEIAAILTIWQLASGSWEIFNPKFVPPPSAVIAQTWEMLSSGRLTEHIVFSVQNFLMGYSLGAVVGVTIGLVIGISHLGDLLISPLVWTAYAVPRSALAPIIVLALGLGAASKVVIIFLLVIFPVLINTMEGGRQIDVGLLNAGRVFGANRKQLMRKIVLPALLPYVLTGLRIGVTRGFIGVLLGEFVGSFKGLGTLLARSAFNFEVATSLAVVLILVVLANTFMLIVTGIKRVVAPWDRETDILAKP